MNDLLGLQESSVISSPRVDRLPRARPLQAPLGVHTFVPQPAVARLDVPILRGIPTARVVQQSPGGASGARTDASAFAPASPRAETAAGPAPGGAPASAYGSERLTQHVLSSVRSAPPVSADGCRPPPSAGRRRCAPRSTWSIFWAPPRRAADHKADRFSGGTAPVLGRCHCRPHHFVHYDSFPLPANRTKARSGALTTPAMAAVEAGRVWVGRGLAGPDQAGLLAGRGTGSRQGLEVTRENRPTNALWSGAALP